MSCGIRSRPSTTWSRRCSCSFRGARRRPDVAQRSPAQENTSQAKASAATLDDMTAVAPQPSARSPAGKGSGPMTLERVARYITARSEERRVGKECRDPGTEYNHAQHARIVEDQ